MAAQAIQVVHFLPGRVRVKLSGLKGNTALAREVQHTLVAIDGIQHVEVSPITGSVLVLYDLGDLRLFIPLTLCFLGFRSLLLTEQLAFPSWYDYLWFAFGTYVALNPTRPVRE